MSAASLFVSMGVRAVSMDVRAGACTCNTGMAQDQPSPRSLFIWQYPFVACFHKAFWDPFLLALATYLTSYLKRLCCFV